MTHCNTDVLFEPVRLGQLTLRNRIVMAPMTRGFATGGMPGTAHVDLYDPGLVKIALNGSFC